MHPTVRQLVVMKRAALGGGAVVAPTVILAILAGQSNMEGRGLTEAQDTNVTGVEQYVGWSGSGSYRTLSSNIVPLIHYSDYTSVSSPNIPLNGPGNYIARQLLTDNPTAKIVLVPTALGGVPMATSGDAWFPTSASGGTGEGYLFANMVTQANLAYAAAHAKYPGSAITVQFYFVQGEQDAGNGVSRATYYASLVNFIAYSRSRVTGAINAPFIIGSMVPDKWDLLNATRSGVNADYTAGYAVINQAHVDASLNISGVKYAVGPLDTLAQNDNLHYSSGTTGLPTQNTRDQGTRMAASLSDVTGPTMTSGATLSNTQGVVLNFPLTASDQHQTFHINGGADAAQFEISDPYLSPVLRWASNGTGPAVGTYVVGVRARDGAGNYGATQTITATVAAAGAVSPATFFTSSQRGVVWDLSDLSSLFQNIAGTTPVTAAGQTVGKILDKSGNNNHWVAAADNTTRPLYQVDSDGKPYLDFDGVNDVLLAATPLVSSANGKFSTTLGVYGATSASQRGTIGTYNTAASSPRLDAMIEDTTGGNTLASFSNDASSSAAPAGVTGVFNSTKRVMTVAYNGTDTVNSTPGRAYRMRDATTRLTGSPPYTVNTAVGSIAENYANLTRASLGARGFGTISGYFVGRIYSGYWINEFLTEAKIKQGEDWVASRVLTSALP